MLNPAEGFYGITARKVWSYFLVKIIEAKTVTVSDRNPGASSQKLIEDMAGKQFFSARFRGVKSLFLTNTGRYPGLQSLRLTFMKF